MRSQSTGDAKLERDDDPRGQVAVQDPLVAAGYGEVRTVGVLAETGKEEILRHLRSVAPRFHADAELRSDEGFDAQAKASGKVRRGRQSKMRPVLFSDVGESRCPEVEGCIRPDASAREVVARSR